MFAKKEFSCVKIWKCVFFKVQNDVNNFGVRHNLTLVWEPYLG